MRENYHFLNWTDFLNLNVTTKLPALQGKFVTKRKILFRFEIQFVKLFHILAANRNGKEILSKTLVEKRKNGEIIHKSFKLKIKWER